MRVPASEFFGAPADPGNSVAGTRFLSSLEQPVRLLVGVSLAARLLNALVDQTS